MLLPHDYKMVARVGGTKWFVASIHQGQRRKQTSQLLSHYADLSALQGPRVA